MLLHWLMTDNAAITWNRLYPTITYSHRQDNWPHSSISKSLRRSDLELFWLFYSRGRVNFNPWTARHTAWAAPGMVARTVTEGQTQLSWSLVASSRKQAACLLNGDLPWDIPLSSAHPLLKWATTAELSPPLATLYEGHSLTNPPVSPFHQHW